MYCPFCGYALPDDAKFCQRCGKKMPDYNKTYSQPTGGIEKVDTVPINQTNIIANHTETTLLTGTNNTALPVAESILTKNTAAPQTDTPKESDLSSEKEVQKEKDSNLGTIVIIVGAIILFIILALQISVAFSNDSPSEIERVSVIVSSNPSGADVYIGGKYQGSTPLTLELMPNTGYMIVVKKDGYEQWAQSINPRDGSIPTTVHASLTPASIYTPYTPSVTQPVVPSSPTTTVDEYIEKHYVWDYDDYTWTYQIHIPKDKYVYYQSLPRKPGNLKEYFSESYNKQFTAKIADMIVEEGTKSGFSKDQCVLMAVSFVQSIPYKTDKESTGMDEYYKYPIETLVDGCGDCEDSAILTACLVRDMGYGVVLLRFPSHVAVGIKGGENIYGTYWTYKGERYFYLETTNTGWDIGQIPDKYKNAQATVIPLN